jgi:Transposase DDE domain group 1
VRGDSHYCAPEVLDFCRANRLDYILGVAPTSTLRRHIEAGLFNALYCESRMQQFSIN